MSLSRGITKLQGMYNVQQQIHEYTHLNWIYEIHICISGLFARCRGLKAYHETTHKFAWLISKYLKPTTFLDKKLVIFKVNI